MDAGADLEIARDETGGATNLRRLLLPTDFIVFAWFGILTVIVLAAWARMREPLAFIGVHALVVGTLGALAWADRRFGGRWWRFLHYWVPVLVILVSFRELHYLIPQVHPFADRSYDRALEAVDRQWFGDVGGFFRSVAARPMADLMHVCYLMYFPIPLALCVALYRRGELARFREVGAILFSGWYLSYLGYFLVPAVGPHLSVDGPRAPELEGFFCSGPIYRLLRTLEMEMPDAFPSGHVIIVVLTLVLAWRYHRLTFWWELPVGLGLILSTMYLRYHYVVDVVAGLAIVPVALLAGRAIARACESGVRRAETRVEAADVT